MSNIVQLVKDFHIAQQQLKAKLKADGEQQLKIVFAEIFAKHPGLKGFTYLGYTPGFNDGDPCYHSGSSAVGLFNMSSYERGGETVTYRTSDFDESSQLSEFFVGEDYEDYADVEEGEEDWQPLNSGCATLEQASADVAEVEDVIEMVYDTNYLIKVTLTDDGVVSVDYEDYDCGH